MEIQHCSLVVEGGDKAAGALDVPDDDRGLRLPTERLSAAWASRRFAMPQLVVTELWHVSLTKVYEMPLEGISQTHEPNDVLGRRNPSMLRNVFRSSYRRPG